MPRTIVEFKADQAVVKQALKDEISDTATPSIIDDEDDLDDYVDYDQELKLELDLPNEPFSCTLAIHGLKVLWRSMRLAVEKDKLAQRHFAKMEAKNSTVTDELLKLAEEGTAIHSAMKQARSDFYSQINHYAVKTKEDEVVVVDSDVTPNAQ